MTLRDAIKTAGGLLTLSDIARAWGVSKARAAEAVKAADFPTPLEGRIGRSNVWIGNEVDKWRSTPRRPGRPKGRLIMR